MVVSLRYAVVAVLACLSLASAGCQPASSANQVAGPKQPTLTERVEELEHKEVQSRALFERVEALETKVAESNQLTFTLTQRMAELERHVPVAYAYFDCRSEQFGAKHNVKKIKKLEANLVPGDVDGWEVTFDKPISEGYAVTLAATATNGKVYYSANKPESLLVLVGKDSAHFSFAIFGSKK